MKAITVVIPKAAASYAIITTANVTAVTVISSKTTMSLFIHVKPSIVTIYLTT